MATVIRNVVPHQADICAAINSTRAALVGSNVHRDAGELSIGFSTLSGTDAAAQAAAIAAANELMQKYLAHIQDIDTVRFNHAVGCVHKGAWTVPSLTTATSVATAQTLVTAIKADFNSHIADTTAHDNADASNNCATADATTLSTLQALANALKTKFNAHMALALGGASMRVRDA